MIYKCPHCDTDKGATPVESFTVNDEVHGDIFKCKGCKQKWTLLWVRGNSYVTKNTEAVV